MLLVPHIFVVYAEENYSPVPAHFVVPTPAEENSPAFKASNSFSSQELGRLLAQQLPRHSLRGQILRPRRRTRTTTDSPRPPPRRTPPPSKRPVRSWTL